MLLRMFLVMLVGVFFGLTISPADARSRMSLTQEQAIAALQQPGAIALMRHALAPGTGDPVNFALGDCRTQRNLNATGRDQARSIGQGLRDKGITFDKVLASQWCRCAETARLMAMGPVTEAPAFNSFFRNMASQPEATRDMRQALAEMSASDTVLIVTHYVNVSALSGHAPRSGEIVVMRRGRDGLELLGTILLAD